MSEQTIVADATNRRKAISCCHCGEQNWIGVSITLDATATAGTESPEAYRESLPDRERIFLKRADKAGLLQAFTDVVNVVKETQMPNNIEKFLLSFFKSAGPRLIPKFALDFYVAEFPNTEISCLQSQGIMAVLADSVIKCFAPSDSLLGVPIKRGSNKEIVGRAGASADDLYEWKRTRWGYVLQGSVMASELKSIPIGGFRNKPRYEITGRH